MRKERLRRNARKDSFKKADGEVPGDAITGLLRWRPEDLAGARPVLRPLFSMVELVSRLACKVLGSEIRRTDTLM